MSACCAYFVIGINFLRIRRLLPTLASLSALKQYASWLFAICTSAYIFALGHYLHEFVVNQPGGRVLTPSCRFNAKADSPVLAPEELYGGRLVAALDRNHPRDWFDVMLLLREEGITPTIRRCFVAYLPPTIDRRMKYCLGP